MNQEESIFQGAVLDSLRHAPIETVVRFIPDYVLRRKGNCRYVKKENGRYGIKAYRLVQRLPFDGPRFRTCRDHMEALAGHQERILPFYDEKPTLEWDEISDESRTVVLFLMEQANPSAYRAALKEKNK